jgi:hypothetical protein
VVDALDGGSVGLSHGGVAPSDGRLSPAPALA